SSSETIATCRRSRSSASSASVSDSTRSSLGAWTSWARSWSGSPEPDARTCDRRGTDARPTSPVGCGRVNARAAIGAGGAGIGVRTGMTDRAAVDGRPTRVGFIGTGAMARSHLRGMIERMDTVVTAVSEPSEPAFSRTAEIFDQHGLPAPHNEPDWRQFVDTWGSQLDDVFIITPHVFHFEQAVACLDAGLDVLLEKPMVMTAEEATALIETRDRTGRLVVVAFQGSLSPQV